ncbi:hypothetical protein Scep_028419 [Stephania cephalantha]|uniref:Pentatricopeptide repeat-containing protein n=1 Tax=Stephania cephalantha TaxID=152367 RepID=A0AAP0HLT2_9MAGN
MPMRNVVSWNCLISGYVAKGMTKEALELFERKWVEKVDRPNVVTWNIKIPTYAGLVGQPPIRGGGGLANALREVEDHREVDVYPEWVELHQEIEDHYRTYCFYCTVVRLRFRHYFTVIIDKPTSTTHILAILPTSPSSSNHAPSSHSDHSASSSQHDTPSPTISAPLSNVSPAPSGGSHEAMGALARALQRHNGAPRNLLSSPFPPAPLIAPQGEEEARPILLDFPLLLSLSVENEHGKPLGFTFFRSLCMEDDQNLQKGDDY